MRVGPAQDTGETGFTQPLLDRLQVDPSTAPHHAWQLAEDERALRAFHTQDPEERSAIRVLAKIGGLAEDHQLPDLVRTLPLILVGSRTRVA